MTDGLDGVYGGSLALLTDLYQLTMACGYWKAGVAEREAVFHLSFRKEPFGGGYAIAAGIAPAIAYLRRLRFTDEDLGYLAGLRDHEGGALFPEGFLAYLRDLRFTCTVHAVPEGAAVFAHEPLIRVQGPIAQAQLVETPLLALVNYQTLVATKASRVCQAARGAPVLEFGLRRAQGIDGSLGGARAAYIGGCAATSSLLAGKLFGIPVSGTHAHSWVMFHGDELAAFRAYADALPGNCTFLVDTYDTLEGVRHAIEVGRELRARGHELLGVRLDSGDLAHLSQQARGLLDAAGFPDAKIVASNDLDEVLIASMQEQGARIDAWGVGTRLVTAYDQPALGGIYKLGAHRDARGAWQDAIKLSEQPVKISLPGILQVRRLSRGGELVGDAIYDSERGLVEPPALHDIEGVRPVYRPEFDRAEDLLVCRLDRGEPVGPADDLEAARRRAAADLAALSPRTKRFLNPQPYPVGLDTHVSARRTQLIAQARATVVAERGAHG
jgi:nicotinate phosphoribosyltransferase